MYKNTKLQRFLYQVIVFIAWFLCILGICLLLAYTWSEFTQIHYCMDEESAKRLAEEAASKVTGNDNFGVHVHNPNIHVTNNWGKAASNLGIGGAVSAGIYAVSQSKRVAAAPIGVKAGAVAIGGIMGGMGFVLSSAANSAVQDRLNSSSTTNDNSNNGPYGEASSMIDEGDGINEIMNFLYLNILVSVSILFLLIILLYLYRNYINKELPLFVIWIFLLLVTLLSIYLAYHLVEDIDIISRIYQQNTSNSVVNYLGLDPSRNHVEETMRLIYANLLLSGCILYLLGSLLALYINTKIINNKWEFNFIKKIFGLRYHRYFMKALTFTSKSNELWMYIIWTLLIIGSLFSIFIAYFLINNIDLITELFEYTKK